MVAVFSIFAALHLVELKMLGIGLSAAVLIDATVVRGILVPAAMALLGDRCWYLPRWLSWLPGRPLDAPANDPRPARPHRPNAAPLSVTAPAVGQPIPRDHPVQSFGSGE